MWILQLVPAICSCLLISAHFQRAGFTLLAFFCLMVPFVLFFKRQWAVRFVQFFLLLSSVEWLRTLFSYVDSYKEAGMPWIRLACILVAVIVFTLFSLFLFQGKTLKEKYRLVK